MSKYVESDVERVDVECVKMSNRGSKKAYIFDAGLPFSTRLVPSVPPGNSHGNPNEKIQTSGEYSLTGCEETKG